MNPAVIIQWTNKYSGEIGYVGSVSTKNRCFYNADRNGAKHYKSEKAAQKAIAQITEYGEAENNNFNVIGV